MSMSSSDGGYLGISEIRHRLSRISCPIDVPGWMENLSQRALAGSETATYVLNKIWAEEEEADACDSPDTPG